MPSWIQNELGRPTANEDFVVLRGVVEDSAVLGGAIEEEERVEYELEGANGRNPLYCCEDMLELWDSDQKFFCQYRNEVQGEGEGKQSGECEWRVGAQTGMLSSSSKSSGGRRPVSDLQHMPTHQQGVQRRLHRGFF